MQTNQRYSISDDVVSREVAGEMVLLDLASGLYFGLDPVGTFVWEKLSEGHASLSDLADAVEQSFDAPRDVIERDLAALFGQLSDKKLVEPV